MNEERMMKRTGRLLLSLLLPIIGIAIAQPASAQKTLGEELELTPIQDQMLEQAGATTVDYWNGQLNEYKQTIDNALSKEDLAQLNRMRVRFAILVDEVGAELNKDLSDEEGTSIELDVNAEESNGWEIMELWTEAMALGAKYDEGLARLEKNFFGDVAEFGTRIETELDAFIAENRSELEADEKGREVLANRSEISTTIADIKDIGEDEGAQMAWGLFIRPIIMLFNGGDLRDLMPPMMGNFGTSDVTDMANALPGLTVLGQNYPNPAADITTLPLDLPTTAAASVKIYDAEGNLVRVDNLGDLPAGASTVDLQVGSLPAGSYVYQLVVDGEAGDRIYSNVMQVVR